MKRRERERGKKEGRHGLKVWCNQLVCRRADANIRTGHGQGEREKRRKRGEMHMIVLNFSATNTPIDWARGHTK